MYLNPDSRLRFQVCIKWGSRFSIINKLEALLSTVLKFKKDNCCQFSNSSRSLIFLEDDNNTLLFNWSNGILTLEGESQVGDLGYLLYLLLQEGTPVITLGSILCRKEHNLFWYKLPNDLPTPSWLEFPDSMVASWNISKVGQMPFIPIPKNLTPALNGEIDHNSHKDYKIMLAQKFNYFKRNLKANDLGIFTFYFKNELCESKCILYRKDLTRFCQRYNGISDNEIACRFCDAKFTENELETHQNEFLLHILNHKMNPKFQNLLDDWVNSQVIYNDATTSNEFLNEVGIILERLDLTDFLLSDNSFCSRCLAPVFKRSMALTETSNQCHFCLSGTFLFDNF